MTVKYKKKTSGPKGDREKAIHLLENTQMTYKEIAELTGVPLGTVGKLALEHRTLNARKENGSHLSKSKKDNPKKLENEVSVTITPDKMSLVLDLSNKVRRHSRYYIQTESAITQAEAISEILTLSKDIASSKENKFNFNFLLSVDFYCKEKSVLKKHNVKYKENTEDEEFVSKKEISETLNNLINLVNNNKEGMFTLSFVIQSSK